MSSMSVSVIALDVGGTHVRSACVNQQGECLAHARRLAELSKIAHLSKPEAEQHVLDVLQKAIAAVAPATAPIGIAFPGFVRGETGVVASSPNLPHLHDFPLAELLQQRLQTPVFVANDALAACVGEHRFGVGQGYDHLLHLTLGTGVGAGLVLHHKPYAGTQGMAMEMGHLCLVPKGRVCACGARGCLEAYASASAVAAIYQQRSADAVDAETVCRRADEGDAIAKQVLAEAGAYLGAAIAEALTLLDLQQVSLSGGLTGAWSHFYPALMQALNAGLIPPMKNTIHVQRSHLDDQAGLLGAAALAFQGVSP